MQKFILFLLALLIPAALCLTATSCSHDDDTVSPLVNPTLPLPGTVYENGDTIHLEANFSDNMHLLSVEAVLVNTDNKPMLANLSFEPGSNPFKLRADYIINDPTLPGGTYHVRFRAYDGVNVTNRFVEVRIHELPRKFLYPLVVTSPEPNQWKAFRLPDNGDWKAVGDLAGDYCGSAVNSPGMQICLSGVYTSGLASFNLPEGLPIWTVKPAFSDKNRWFEAITFRYPNFYTACNDGALRGYDRSGHEIYKSGAFTQGVPYQVAASSTFVMGAYRDAFSNDRFLTAFHYPGGLMTWNQFFEDDVVALVPAGDNKMLIFSNQGDESQISLFNGTDQSFSVIHPLSEGRFYAAAAMDDENFLVSSSNGILLYQMALNSLTPFNPNAGYRQIACDDLSYEVYACRDNQLDILNFPGGELQRSIPLPDTAVDLHLLFNK
jgi:hypothetical protein